MNSQLQMFLIQRKLLNVLKVKIKTLKNQHHLQLTSNLNCALKFQ